MPRKSALITRFGHFPGLLQLPGPLCWDCSHNDKTTWARAVCLGTPWKPWQEAVPLGVRRPWAAAASFQAGGRQGSVPGLGTLRPPSCAPWPNPAHLQAERWESWAPSCHLHSSCGFVHDGASQRSGEGQTFALSWSFALLNHKEMSTVVHFKCVHV